jgi:hypothetical protein
VLSTGLINRSEFLAYTAVMLVYVILSGAALGWLLLRGSPTQLARAA